MKYAIVVHGGAGTWDVPPSRLEQAVAACQEAVNVAQVILRSGKTALDAVEAAVQILEDSPVLDAGRGSYLNANGEVEMDALIMDGATLSLGAVAAVRLVSHPISLARRIMTDCEHNFLVGFGAEAFADKVGFPRCTPADLVTEEQLALFLKDNDTADNQLAGIDFHGDVVGDTVGAVALDTSGNLAAATSTGGINRKLPGRVGDSPLVGSGAYADNWTAAVSATGYGEALMKVLISKRVCDFIADGLSAQKACEAALNVLKERVGAQGGLIAIDMRGCVGIAYSTGAMPHAFAIDDDKIVTGK